MFQAGSPRPLHPDGVLSRQGRKITLQSRLIGKAQCIGSEGLCRRRCLIAHRDQLVYAQLPCVTPDFMMKGLTVLP
ncbi:MAG: hypothetical protein CM15mP89_1150 [Gammaproteobacteria bacterium]|nr:MAG: hypothetical protein CM15mP89_1150 [Gammaproteobacteria bacterium]